MRDSRIESEAHAGNRKRLVCHGRCSKFFLNLSSGMHGCESHLWAVRLRMVSLTALFFFILTIDKSHAQDAAYYREMVAKNPQKYGSLWNAAQGMEMTFVREMIKGMRKTVQESPEMKNNQGFQIFRSMLDDQYAEITVQSQGIGLAEMIVKQVTEMEESERVKNSSVRVRELNKSDLIRK